MDRYFEVVWNLAVCWFSLLLGFAGASNFEHFFGKLQNLNQKKQQRNVKIHCLALEFLASGLCSVVLRGVQGYRSWSLG